MYNRQSTLCVPHLGLDDCGAGFVSGKCGPMTSCPRYDSGVIQGIKGLGTNSPSESEKILILMTMRLYIWMMPCVALPLSERRHREGKRNNELSWYCGKLSVRCRIFFRASSFPATYHQMCHPNLVCVPGRLGSGNLVRLGNKISPNPV